MNKEIQELLKDPCLECPIYRQCSIPIYLKNSPIPFIPEAFIEDEKVLDEDLKNLMRCLR